MSDERTLRIGESTVDPDSLEWRDVWKRPVKVEAVEMPAPFTVETLEGTMEGSPGDMLVRGVVDELYPCDPSIFYRTYISEGVKVPRYSAEDISAARREFRENTLEHVPVGVTDTDARAGVRAFIRLLTEHGGDP